MTGRATGKLVGDGSQSGIATPGCLRSVQGVSKPRMLDLFCGAGGAAMGYHRAGFEVVGVDHVDQPNYPFTFIQADALDYLRNTTDLRAPYFDAIHASPPCQAFTAYRRRGGGVGDGYLDLIAMTRDLLEIAGLPYVIENVPGAPLREAVQLCGSSFGLDVRRHRLFECSFPIMVPSCQHHLQTPRFPQATNRTNLRSTVEIGAWRIPLAVQQVAMDVYWTTLEELSEAVPPAYTAYIGTQLLRMVGHSEDIDAAQTVSGSQNG